jgi:hypothetical protein
VSRAFSASGWTLPARTSCHFRNPMAYLNPADYDRLERAVHEGHRIAVVRQGRELVVVPTRLYMWSGRETIEARHPVTGDVIALRIDDLDSLEVISR